MELKPGKYTAKLSSFDFGTTKKGTEHIVCIFDVVGGDCDGEQVYWYGYFSEKAAERTIESLRHMGWKGDDLSEITLEEIQGEVQIVVETNTYRDTCLRVSWVNPAQVGGKVAVKNAMDPMAKKAFAERMRGMCMSSKPARKPAQSRQATVDYPPDDDIPF
jgi:hypothetical protein